MQLYNEDYRTRFFELIKEVKNPVVVTDPPFNIGYHYKGFTDKIPKEEYLHNLAKIINCVPTVMINTPENICELCIASNLVPKKLVSWVYNSNTEKQHRDIAFWNVKPDFNKVRQPYKNYKDKRIQKLVARGFTGARIYDWWQVDMVKNRNKNKTAHPCQMPLKVMTNIIGILPDDITVIDPFMGSGTTGIACLHYHKEFIGFELVEEYYHIAQERIKEAEGLGGLFEGRKE